MLRLVTKFHVYKTEICTSNICVNNKDLCSLLHVFAEFLHLEGVCTAILKIHQSIMHVYDCNLLYLYRACRILDAFLEILHFYNVDVEITAI